MLLMSVGYRPCFALWSLVSDGRVTDIVPSSSFSVNIGSTLYDNSPLGPVTVTRFSSVHVTCTFGGTAMGARPIRDILIPSCLPNVANDFTTKAFAESTLPCHQALRCRQNGHTQPSTDARDVNP